MRINQEGRQELGRQLAKYLRAEIGTDDLVKKVSDAFAIEYPNAGPTWTRWGPKFEELLDALMEVQDHEYAPNKVTRLNQAFADVLESLRLNFGGKSEDYLVP